MSRVIALSEVRAERRARGEVPEQVPKPEFHLPDILARDYSTPEGAMFAALKIREILAWSIPEEPAWRDLVLELVEAAHSLKPETGGRLYDAVAVLKHYTAMHTTEANRRDIGPASILLAFMEQSLARAPAVGE